MVSSEKYRFTVLTPSLIRMEYSSQGVFEDRASQSVFFRDFPANQFSKESKNGWLTIETENLILTYKENEVFSTDTLSVKLKIEPASTWNYGEDFEDFAEISSEYGTRNGVLDDDLPDYDFFEDAIEGVDFYEVDLDKECGWTEK
jgi:hypothetical protein